MARAYFASQLVDVSSLVVDSRQYTYFVESRSKINNPISIKYNIFIFTYKIKARGSELSYVGLAREPQGFYKLLF